MKIIVKVLNKLVLYGYRIIHQIGAICLSGIILSITVGIFTRYVLNSPVTWSEELCCFLMVHLCFISAATTTVQKKHIVADFFIAKTPKEFQRIMGYISRVLQLIFFGVLFYSVLVLLPTLIWKSPVLRIPREFYYLSCIICSVFMFIAVLTDILNDFFPGYDSVAEYNLHKAEIARLEEEKETEQLQKDMDTFVLEAKEALKKGSEGGVTK